MSPKMKKTICLKLMEITDAKHVH